MKIKLKAGAIGILLILGALVLPAGRAEAHNFDNYSLWYCAGHRPNGTAVIDSWPYYMASGEVGYWCKAGLYGVNFQYWVHWDQDTGHSWRPWDYQKCKPAQGGIVWCGTAGHF